MDQVDSVNLTYDYLDECIEYSDSLESTIGRLSRVIDRGKEAEGLLNDALDLQKKINSLNDIIISELKSDNKSCERKLKFNKFVSRFSSGILVIMGGLLLLSNV